MNGFRIMKTLLFVASALSLDPQAHPRYLVSSASDKSETDACVDLLGRKSSEGQLECFASPRFQCGKSGGGVGIQGSAPTPQYALVFFGGVSHVEQAQQAVERDGELTEAWARSDPRPLINVSAVAASLQTHLFQPNGGKEFFDVYIHSWTMRAAPQLIEDYQPVAAVFESNRARHKVIKDKLGIQDIVPATYRVGTESIGRGFWGNSVTQASAALSRREGLALVRKHETRCAFRYQRVVLMRPDVIFWGPADSDALNLSNEEQAPRNRVVSNAGAGDYHWIMSSDIARKFSFAFDWISPGKELYVGWMREFIVQNATVGKAPLTSAWPVCADGRGQEVVRKLMLPSCVTAGIWCSRLGCAPPAPYCRDVSGRPYFASDVACDNATKMGASVRVVARQHQITKSLAISPRGRAQNPGAHSPVPCPKGCVALFIEKGGCIVLGIGDTRKIQRALPESHACGEMGKIDTCAEEAFVGCNMSMHKAHSAAKRKFRLDGTTIGGSLHSSMGVSSPQNVPSAAVEAPIVREQHRSSPSTPIVPCARNSGAGDKSSQVDVLPRSGRVAVVFRGLPFSVNTRAGDGPTNTSHGCRETGRVVQLRSSQSAIEALVIPLERLGNQVDILFVSSVQQCALMDELRELFNGAVGGLSDGTARVKLMKGFDSTGQAQSVLMSCSALNELARGTGEEVAEHYDMVVLARFDLHWSKPIDEWEWPRDPASCPGIGFRFLSKCIGGPQSLTDQPPQRASPVESCVQDVAHIMDGKLWLRWASVVSKCFGNHENGGINVNPYEGGHHCWSLIAKAVGERELHLLTDSESYDEVRTIARSEKG